jgi:hypothetical protein
MNWDITQGEGAARIVDGYTNKQVANSFVTIQTAGVRELALRLQKAAAIAGDMRALERCVVEAAKVIERGYKSRIRSATGNLKRSVRTKPKAYPESGGVIAITGPVQTGPVGSSDAQASGNHAWLHEFGTGPRKPGSQGRRTYINVHQAINGKMTRHSSANDEQFSRMGKGYYFLMGSANVPGRQSGRGAFVKAPGGGTRPYYLGPNETYGAMPASHAMKETIDQEQMAVFNTLKSAIKNTLKGLES